MFVLRDWTSFSNGNLVTNFAFVTSIMRLELLAEVHELLVFRMLHIALNEDHYGIFHFVRYDFS